jgi:hypothetical protein
MLAPSPYLPSPPTPLVACWITRTGNHLPKSMARITTIDEPKARGKAKSHTAPLPPATPLPVVVLGVLSIVVGVAVHIKAIHMAPDGDGKILMTWTSDQSRKHLNLAHSWPGTRFFDDYADKCMSYFMVLLVIFKKICVDRTGRGLCLLVSTCIAPFCSFLAVEGLKDGNSMVLSIGTLIAVTSLGQIICIGAAMPLVMGPLYAYIRWTEVRRCCSVQLLLMS